MSSYSNKILHFFFMFEPFQTWIHSWVNFFFRTYFFFSHVNNSLRHWRGRWRGRQTPSVSSSSLFSTLIWSGLRACVSFRTVSISSGRFLVFISDWVADADWAVRLFRSLCPPTRLVVSLGEKSKHEGLWVVATAVREDPKGVCPPIESQEATVTHYSNETHVLTP